MLPLDPQGQDPQGQDLKGLGPLGQVRIYQGAQYRFIWPVHLAGWLELGWTTEPGVTPGATPGATPGGNGPGVTTALRKKRASSSPSGVSSTSAKAVEPIPVLVTDFLVDPSVPTND